MSSLMLAVNGIPKPQLQGRVEIKYTEMASVTYLKTSYITSR
jgi:hypothetical protein